MKLQIVSDLHLEFGPISIENAGADVLILSGDICTVCDIKDEKDTSKKSSLYHKFFRECAERFKHVIYISGNHEHYHGDIAKSHDRLKEKLDYLSNLYILEREVKVIDDVTFIAGTLWTDMNKEDPITLSHIRNYMNDYRIIKDSPNGRFTPSRSVELHKEMLDVLKQTLSRLPLDAKVVVVGHHAPSKQSIKPKYMGDTIVNGAYSSDLSEIILDSPMIKLWTHGHTHDSFDYMIGSTRVVCNPRGYYNYEENTSFNPNAIWEI